MRLLLLGLLVSAFADILMAGIILITEVIPNYGPTFQGRTSMAIALLLFAAGLIQAVLVKIISER